jgi:hypothetical protein
MQKETVLLGALHISISIIYILISISLFVILYSRGFFSTSLNGTDLWNIVAVVSGIFFLAFAFFGIIGGIGIIHDLNWAQMLILVLGCLNLVCIPIGTALGIYTILIFMGKKEEIQMVALPEISNISKDIQLKNGT